MGRPIVINLQSNIRDNNFNRILRQQMNYFHLKEVVGGIDGIMWVHIGHVDYHDIIEKNEGVLDEVKNWIRFLGFSRIDGCPMFQIPTNSLDANIPIIDIFRNNGIYTLSNQGDAVNFFLDPNIIIHLVSMIEDHLPSFAGFSKGKQIFSEADPYGEEAWEDN